MQSEIMAASIWTGVLRHRGDALTPDLSPIWTILQTDHPERFCRRGIGRTRRLPKWVCRVLRGQVGCGEKRVRTRMAVVRPGTGRAHAARWNRSIPIFFFLFLFAILIVLIIPILLVVPFVFFLFLFFLTLFVFFLVLFDFFPLVL
jgi:hypothetical protein